MIRSIIRRARKAVKGQEAEAVRSTLRRMICAVLAACLFPALLQAQAEETDLKTLQARLIRLGYEIGTADGILGQKTTAAIALAQALLAGQGYDVQATGIPDAKTAELILQEENNGILRTLMKGSWGSRVKEVQRTLTGLNLLQGSADGKYGPDTETAVLAFEKQLDDFLEVLRKNGFANIREEAVAKALQEQCEKAQKKEAAKSRRPFFLHLGIILAKGIWVVFVVTKVHHRSSPFSP